jgi:predicted nucleic-acid-binding protein
MIGLDTNLLVRFFMQDEVVQTAAVSRLFATLDSKNPGYVSLVVLVELHWVLERFYQVDQESRWVITESMLSTDQLQVENSEIVWQALRMSRGSNAGFPDCLISMLGQSAGCKTVYTFDKQAAKKTGMSLLN